MDHFLLAKMALTIHDRRVLGNSHALRSLYERRLDRIAVNAKVSLRRSGQLNYRVRVYDASTLGCKLEFVERPQLEERVWIKFERMDPIEGIVCWADGLRAGIEFANPIHPAVFETLLPRLR